MKSNRLSNLPLWVEVATLRPGDVVKLEDYGDDGEPETTEDGWAGAHYWCLGSRGGVNEYWTGESALPLWVVCQPIEPNTEFVRAVMGPIPTIIVSLEDGEMKHAPKYAWDYTETVEVKIRER